MTPTRIARYEVQRRLGAGGMGSLYLARDPGLERLVAIKLLKDEYQDDPDLRERFTREARSVARLRHPNIIIVFEIGDDEGRPFIAMEYIAGETLDVVLRRRPSLSLIRRLSLMEDLCAGLAHAHAAGIIHRDIKPANVMLDADGVLKILDFGIARIGNSGMTQDGAMMGTVNYMSPEQIKGRGVDHRTDIFAAGAVVYEAVALEQAFPGRIDSGVLQRILVDGAPPLEERVPGVDPELASVVRHALERDPAKRYHDVTVLRRDLARVRRRLMELEQGPAESGSTDDRPTMAPRPPAATPPRRDSDRPRRLNPERIAELQRQQVDEYLRFAQEAIERGEHDTALHYAERVVTVDPDNRSAFDLIDRARFAIETKAIRHLLAEAQRLLTDGQLDDAAALVGEASLTLPDLEGAESLREDVRRAVEQVGAAQDRERRIADALERARSAVERGGLETALRAVYEVLALDPERAEARDLERRAQSRIRAQREHERVREQAYAQLRSARELSNRGEHEAAIAAIAAVPAVSDTVRLAAADALAVTRAAQRQAAQARIVDGAQSALAAGRLDEALAALDAIPPEERDEGVDRVRVKIEEALAARRELERKRRLIDGVLASVGALIDADQLARAAERLHEASDIGLADPRISELRTRIEAGQAAAEDRRRDEARARRASQRVDAARQLLEGGDARAAIALLERDDTGHPSIEQAIGEARAVVVQQEERVRLEAERRRQQEESRRLAELKAARAREDEQRADEQRAQAQAAATIVATANATEVHEIALNLLTEAMKVVPGDPAVLTLIHDRTVALERQRTEEQRREQEARERAEAESRALRDAEQAAAAEAERRREEQRAGDIVARARALFTDGQHDAAVALLRDAPAHPSIAHALGELRAQVAEFARVRMLAERARVRSQRRASAAAMVRRITADRRARIATMVILVAGLAWGGWQLLPDPAPDQAASLPNGPGPPAGSEAANGAGISSGGTRASDRAAVTSPRVEPGVGVRPADAPVTSRPAPPVVTPPRADDDRPPARATQQAPLPGPAAARAAESSATALPPPPPAATNAATQEQPSPPVPDRSPIVEPERRPPVVAAGPNLQQDRAEIQALLNEYVGAYNRLDDARLKSIDPAFDGIRNRGVIRSIELRLPEVSIAVAPDGLSAVLTATGAFHYVWNRANMPPTTAARYMWSLRKVNGNWVVTR